MQNSGSAFSKFHCESLRSKVYCRVACDQALSGSHGGGKDRKAPVGEGEVAFFSAKHWDRRNRADLIESVTPCHDAQVVGPYRDSKPLRLTILAAMSEDYTTAPQHLQNLRICCIFTFYLPDVTCIASFVNFLEIDILNSHSDLFE